MKTNLEIGTATEAVPAQAELLVSADGIGAGGLAGFEVYVAAGQVWFCLPGHPQCRAMYPEHARALALALERTADDGKDRRVFIADGRFFSITSSGVNGISLREDTTVKLDADGVAVTFPSARGLAREVRDAANRAERGAWVTRAA
jgi:hypothetical protein